MYVFNGLNKIILLRNIIKFLIFLFQIMTIFHEVCGYFRSFLRISHEFFVYDLDQSFLFQVIISWEKGDYSAATR